MYSLHIYYTHVRYYTLSYIRTVKREMTMEMMLMMVMVSWVIRYGLYIIKAALSSSCRLDLLGSYNANQIEFCAMFLNLLFFILVYCSLFDWYIHKSGSLLNKDVRRLFNLSKLFRVMDLYLFKNVCITMFSCPVRHVSNLFVHK